MTIFNEVMSILMDLIPLDISEKEFDGSMKKLIDNTKQ